MPTDDRPTAIRFEKASTFFDVKDEASDSALENFIRLYRNLSSRGARQRRAFQALKDISFDIKQGEVVGFIGPNGAGKSTLLRLMAGILKPDEGVVEIHGRAAALLELGAGFHPELSGRENVFLNGAILGIPKKRTAEMMDRIIDFAELRDFIDRPLKTYSSGMQVRLGFSIAANIDPDILIVDEVLAVGDESFQRKCVQTLREFHEQGKTIIIVSHDLGAVSSLCDRIFLMFNGEIISRGNPSETINYYLSTVGDKKGIEIISSPHADVVFNNGRVSLFHEGKELTNGNGIYFRVESGRLHYDATGAEWRVAREENLITATGRIHALELDVILTVEAEDGKRLRYRLDLRTHRHTEIKSLETAFLFKLLYGEWATPFDQQPFHAIATEDRAWITQSGAMLQLPPVAFYGNPEREEVAPSLLIQCHTPKDCVGHVYNSDYSANSRVVQVVRSFPHEGIPADTRVTVTDTAIDIGISDGEIDTAMKKHRALFAVRAAEAETVFANGKATLYHRDREITAGQELYASIFSQDTWHDSNQAIWNVRKQGDVLRAEGKFRRLPLIQRWELSAPEGNRFHIKITIELLEQFELKEFHASVCLNHGYAAWELENERGDFPPIPADQHEWIHLNRENVPTPFIRATGAEESDLPAVRFVCAPETAQGLIGSALNADAGGNARVMQYLKINATGTSVYAPGVHPYFEGDLYLD